MAARRIQWIFGVALFLASGCACEIEVHGMFNREMGAQKAIQTIHTAEVQYQSQFGRFANSLRELGPPSAGTANESASDLIDGGLASGRKGGYRFELKGTNSGYEVWAEPETFGVSGARTWYSDQTMIIHYNQGPERANAKSPEVGQAASRKTN
jgi:hypothetical protein